MMGFGKAVIDTRVPIIIDTDHSSDADDVTDLQIAAWAHTHRLTNILAVGLSTSAQYGPGAMDATLTHMGISGYQIGCWKGAPFDPNALGFNQDLYNTYPHPNANQTSTTPDALSVFNTILSARKTPDVVMIATGAMNMVDALLTAHPTAIINGISKLIVVAGNNDGTVEANVNMAPIEASRVAANWPTELIQCPCSLGWAIDTIGGSLATGCPGKRALTDMGTPGGRPAWSPPAYDLAAGFTSLYTLTAGTWSVNASTHIDTFTVGAGPHKLLGLVNAPSTYQTRYNSLLMEHAG